MPKEAKTNIIFESLLGLALGLFLGVYANLFLSFLCTIFFEYYVFVAGEINGNPSDTSDRVLVNMMYIFGWVLSKFLFTRETGFEDLITNIDLCYNTFPN